MRFPGAQPEEVQLVRDFQRYIHMRAFDATGARPYCDLPATLNATLSDLEARSADYSRRRELAVTTLTRLPLGQVVERVCDSLALLLPGSGARPSGVGVGG